MMTYGRVVRQMLLAGLFAVLAFAPSLPLPGAAKLGLGGPAAAQEGFAIDSFYDALAPYGEWVYHPQHGYVWVPQSVSEGWRPYTIGHWVYTNEYGWYWDSYEPFAWAVYHYGRWGYDPAFGWYWVPGDTWAPAWVQWRYSDDYVGWAPIGPHRFGYAYGAPVSYEPPVVESWVFVRPRYLTSRVIFYHALPPASLNIVFNRATNIYSPVFRNGYVYNYGMPRDRWSQITRRQITARNLYLANHRGLPGGWNAQRNRALYVYAPGVEKGVKPRWAPRNVSQTPPHAKARLKSTVTAPPPKGWGRSAALLKPNPPAGIPNSVRLNQKGQPGLPLATPQAGHKANSGGEAKVGRPGTQASMKPNPPAGIPNSVRLNQKGQPGPFATPQAGHKANGGGEAKIGLPGTEASMKPNAHAGVPNSVLWNQKGQSGQGPNPKAAKLKQAPARANANNAKSPDLNAAKSKAAGAKARAAELKAANANRAGLPGPNVKPERAAGKAHKCKANPGSPQCHGG